MGKEFRPSIERMNAPYRGVSSRQDAVNFELATLHDLFHLQKVSGGNRNIVGHKDYIRKNLAAIFIGESDVKTSAPTAGNMISRLGEVQGASALNKWSPDNGAQLTKKDHSYLIKTDGLRPQAVFSKVITVNPGDIIQMRFKAKSIKESNTVIALGALNFSNEGDELDFLPLGSFEGGKYIEKRLYCTSRQEVQLVVYAAYETTQGNPVEWEVSDFSIEWLSEVSVGLSGLENTVKPKIEVAIQNLNYIDEQSKKRGGNL